MKVWSFGFPKAGWSVCGHSCASASVTGLFIEVYREVMINTTPCPLIINLAPTGSVAEAERHPHVPLCEEKILEDVIACARAGVSMVHLHVRDETGKPSAEVGRFQTLISALQLTLHPKKTLVMLMNKKITAIAWDYIQDEHNIFTVVRAMGEIAGNTSVLIAAELLSDNKSGKPRKAFFITPLTILQLSITFSGVAA